MVMVTRSAYKKACESFDQSDLSHQNIVPPWCSSGKVYQRKRRRGDSTRWEVSSAYPARENIWEYLYESNSVKLNKRKNKTYTKHTAAKNNGCGKIIALFIILIVGGMLVSLWMSNKIPKVDLITKVIPRTRIMTLLGYTESTGVIEECLQNIIYLKAKLFKAERQLRNSVRQSRYKLLPESNEVNVKVNKYYIHGATIVKGDDTNEWGGRVALWGVIPLWRASRPLHTVLSLRKPMPGDCWPFTGTYGELIIKLPKIYPVSCISIQHIHPDAARSAPNRFVIYGIQANDTTVKVINSIFDSKKPTKQHYLFHQEIYLKGIIVRVITNSGNPKYTCIYRIHVYSSVMDS